jgi:hypothetical protein
MTTQPQTQPATSQSATYKSAIVRSAIVQGVVDPAPETVRTEASDPRWSDRLVELHVLAEHGDVESAVAAEKWMAADVEARHVWDHVEHVRNQLQG